MIFLCLCQKKIFWLSGTHWNFSKPYDNPIQRSFKFLSQVFQVLLCFSLNCISSVLLWDTKFRRPAFSLHMIKSDVLFWRSFVISISDWSFPPIFRSGSFLTARKKTLTNFCQCRLRVHSVFRMFLWYKVDQISAPLKLFSQIGCDSFHKCSFWNVFWYE